MSFLDEIKNGSQSVLNNIKSAAAKYKSVDFRDAVLSICAMVAAADGVIAQEERDKVKRLIMSNEALGHFTPSDLGKQFESYIPKADEADMAVKIGLIIANSDGDFAESEKKVMVAIIKKLGLNAADYGL